MLQAVATPDSLSEIQAILASGGGARLVAGGTVVMPEFNYGTDAFTRLVSLRRAGLSGISVEAGRATVGAATTLSDVADHADLAFLQTALDAIASPTIRNMATVGGNLFAKQPYGDFAACLIALGADAAIAGPNGERSARVEDLVKDGVKPDEIVTAVGFDLPPDGAFRFAKAGRKTLNAAAIVTVAAVLEMAGGKVAGARIALGGVARHAGRARSVEAALKGGPLDRESVEAAARQADGDIDPFDDAYASAWYRRRVTPVHIRRALIGE